MTAHEHIYQALTHHEREIRENDKALREMLGVLVLKLMKKKILDSQEADEILMSTMFEESTKKE
jgi:hypothetical protein